MRILGLTVNNIDRYNATNSANFGYVQSHNAKLLHGTVKNDVIKFGAKIPSIVTPTMEDIVNKTKAEDILRYNVLRLAKYKIPCPVCGRIMLPVDEFKTFEADVAAATSPKEILRCVEKLKSYLHPVEYKIYSMMKEDLSYHPNKPLLDVLKTRLLNSEEKIVKQQSSIFTDIGLLSRELPYKEMIQVQNLLNDSFDRILDPRDTSRFSRHAFIDKLKIAFIPKEKLEYLKELYTTEFESKYKDTNYYSPSNKEVFVSNNLKLYVKNMLLSETQQKILNEAIKLPMAYNNVDAFIVKYAKRDYKNANPDKKIALRMLSNSMATVEHIKPSFRRGDTEPPNLALECAGDNNRKGDSSLIDQIIENPQMIENYPVYMSRLCEIHNMRKVEKAYVTQQNKTFCKESYGLLNANLSSMNIFYRSKIKSSKHKFFSGEKKISTSKKRTSKNI